MRQIAQVMVLLAAANAFGQTPAKDPDGLQALLVEVRQLRQDIEAMTVASQRVQIALQAWQMQTSAVSRGVQRLDDVRNKKTSAEASRDRMTYEIQQLEAAVASGALNPDQLRDVQQRLPQMKRELDRITAEAQAWQAAEAEASTQLHNDQTKLTDVQDRIDRLDRVLEKLGLPGGK